MSRERGVALRADPGQIATRRVVRIDDSDLMIDHPFIGRLATSHPVTPVFTFGLQGKRVHLLHLGLNDFALGDQPGSAAPANPVEGGEARGNRGQGCQRKHIPGRSGVAPRPDWTRHRRITAQIPHAHELPFSPLRIGDIALTGEREGSG